MTQIAIDDEVAAHLASSAASSGCSEADLASALLGQALRMAESPLIAAPLTPSAEARIQEGIEASLRGDVVHHEEVEAFFDDWERELRA